MRPGYAQRDVGDKIHHYRALKCSKLADSITSSVREELNTKSNGANFWKECSKIVFLKSQ